MVESDAHRRCCLKRKQLEVCMSRAGLSLDQAGNDPCAEFGSSYVVLECFILIKKVCLFFFLQKEYVLRRWPTGPRMTI